MDTWFTAVKRTKAPLSWMEVVYAYRSGLMKIKSLDQVVAVRDEHLSEWSSVIFGDKAIDNGLKYEQCWSLLGKANSDPEYNLPSEAP